MIRFLIELWPATLPLLLYVLVMLLRRRKAKKAGDDKPSWLSGPWFWTVLASAAIVVLCLFVLGIFSGESKGEYIPPHLENGVVVPGKVGR